MNFKKFQGLIDEANVLGDYYKRVLMFVLIYVL